VKGDPAILLVLNIFLFLLADLDKVLLAISLLDLDFNRLTLWISFGAALELELRTDFRSCFALKKPLPRFIALLSVLCRFGDR
jgi:hypothetical protein